MRHFMCASFGGDDARIGYEAVTKGMIAIGVRIHQLRDVAGCHASGGMHRVQHFGGEPFIEERVDKQRLVAVHDQSRVAISPRSRRLEIGKMPIAQRMEALCKRYACHQPSS